MPQDMKEWRHNAKKKLKEELGGKCCDCGRTEDEVPLMFAHITPLTDEQSAHRARVGANSRMVLYRKEAKENLLTLRCQSCNVKQSKEPKQGVFTFDVATVFPF